jgi:flagellar basal body-associated protein FliL
MIREIIYISGRFKKRLIIIIIVIIVIIVIVIIIVIIYLSTNCSANITLLGKLMSNF